MAGNFKVVRLFIYIAGNIIDPNQNNPNETRIYGAHNNSMDETTGHQHTGAPGDAPKISASGIDLTADYAWTGIHTFLGAKLRVGGAGAGLAFFQYANSATSRTFTFPDPGADDTVLTTKVVQVAGAGAGLATLVYVNSATSRTYTIPDAGAAGAEVVLTKGPSIITGKKTYSGADTLIIPVVPPTAVGGDGSMGMSAAGGALEIYSSATGIAEKYLRQDNTAQNAAVVVALGLVNDGAPVVLATFPLTVTIPGKFLVTFTGNIQTTMAAAVAAYATQTDLSVDETVDGLRYIGAISPSSDFTQVAVFNTNVRTFFSYTRIVSIPSVGVKNIELRKTNVASLNLATRFIDYTFTMDRVADL